VDGAGSTLTQSKKAEDCRHMYYRAARERARTAADQLNFLEPVSLRSIQAHLETASGRKIVIKPMDSTPTDKVCGLWFGLDSMDLHEFAHMILRHEQEVVSHDYAKVFFPDLDPERVIGALKRTDFQDEFEVTAELLADCLASRIRRSLERSDGQPGKFGAVFG
jgi:hypothetical protein